MPTPLYKQVKQTILKEINHHMKEGDLLPTEGELEKKHDVSRITIRKAIDSLVTEGYVEKIQGKGTFVKSTKIVQDAGSITSWTEEMHLKGKKPDTVKQHIYEVSPSLKMKRKLNLQPNEKIICVERIRLADGEPLALMFNYLREKYIPGFLENGFTRESLYEELEKNYDIVLEDATEQIKARLATDLEASRLGISPEDAVMHITRTTFLPNGAPFEMVEMVSRSDKYEYHINVSGRNKNKTIR
ncbi:MULTISPECIES: GntR family transcriptional regulator [Oceanobacillus]|uniref:GntR family transcriptional regulator n=1 Tax=Oceanobacillus neutriphilus TaxID=531815 RepID=A0ABQ2NR41_9BACI|nr:MULTISPECIES: GntR family transcriptional regulator [Oceanobacillus]GGP07592.1 GntR family transcriptional regulator [Oceanobacillus neutriphilus]